MTQEQTRQLGIEFERRLQTMFPEIALNKLNTDTIYSFLSEYQLLYVKQLILADGQLESGSKASNKINDTLKDLIKHSTLYPKSTDYTLLEDNVETFDIPLDYFMYIRSTSCVNKNYKSNTTYSPGKLLTNTIVKESDIEKVVKSHDDENKILRHPVVVIEGDLIKVYRDRYTGLTSLNLVYYKQPNPFNIINYNDSTEGCHVVRSKCSLPYSCFDELVSGAVAAYATYKTNVDLNKSQAEKTALKNLTGGDSTKEAKS